MDDSCSPRVVRKDSHDNRAPAITNSGDQVTSFRPNCVPLDNGGMRTGGQNRTHAKSFAVLLGHHCKCTDFGHLGINLESATFLAIHMLL
jgi:hypothetical protein